MILNLAIVRKLSGFSLLKIFCASMAFAAIKTPPVPAGSVPVSVQQRADSMEQALQSGSCSISGNISAINISAGSGESSAIYRWKAPTAGSLNWFGALEGDFGAGKVLRWNEDAALTWVKAPENLTHAGWTIKNKSAKLEGMFSDGAKIFLDVRCVGSGLSIVIKSSSQVFKNIRFPTLREDSKLIILNVPYDPYPVFYRNDGLFISQYFDWTRSNASRISYPDLEFGALTNGTRLAPNDRLVIAAGRKLEDAFPPQINPRSPWLNDLAGRVVLDIWNDKSFADVEAGLGKLSDSDIGRCAVIIHMWQQHGYDNGLPDVTPAYPRYGGDPGLKALAVAVRKLGCRLALHQNYVDYYPNYSGFNKNDLVHNWEGAPGLAWFNKRANAQAYASRPDRFVSLAARHSLDVHRRYATSASYIDQNSGLLPWWRSDRQANRIGAGRFWPFVENSVALWAQERLIHGGPVFGEGQFNFYWAGYIDGVEAQLSSPFGNNNAVTLPLLVNFDLFRIHGWSADHGMGYPDRWQKEFLTNRGPDREVMMDIYRMQEIAFGHQPFISSGDWRDPMVVWTEAHLIAPVARRYGAANATEIRYFVNGSWRPVEDAIINNRLKVVRVKYDNGLIVTANGGSLPIVIGGLELRRGGWFAEGGGIRAGSGWVDGRRMEFVDSQDEVFAQLRVVDGKTMNFGSVETDGSVSLIRRDKKWTLKVIARMGTTTALLRADRFPVPIAGINVCGQILHPIVVGGRWSVDTRNCTYISWKI